MKELRESLGDYDQQMHVALHVQRADNYYNAILNPDGIRVSHDRDGQYILLLEEV